MKRSNSEVKSITLDINKYYSFLRLMSMFKDICKDIDIRDGVIRQKTSDGAALIEIDLTYLINDISVPLVFISKKLDLLKAFQGQEVMIESTDKIIKISDRHSSFEFKKPSPNYIEKQNRFIPADEIQHVINIADEDLILVTSITKTISDRIKTTSKVFEHNAINVSFLNDMGTISMSKDSKDQHVDLVKDIPLEHTILGDTVLSSTPFVIDHDGDIIFKMYGVNEKQALSQFKMIVDDINITIYHRSTLNVEQIAGGDSDE